MAKFLQVIGVGLFLLAAVCLLMGAFAHRYFTYAGYGCVLLGFLVTMLIPKNNTGNKR